jgi:putative sterol carrier protein
MMEQAKPTPAQIFEGMGAAFQPDKAAGLDLVFQYILSGPNGGEWNMTIKDQKCEINEGQADNPTTTIKMTDDDFIALIMGELDGMTAFTSGKLKVEGDMMKAQVMGTLFAPPQS